MIYQAMIANVVLVKFKDFKNLLGAVYNGSKCTD